MYSFRKVLENIQSEWRSRFLWLSELKILNLIPYCIFTQNTWIGLGQQNVVDRMKVVDEEGVHEEGYEEIYKEKFLPMFS